jgi:hypothetical protein
MRNEEVTIVLPLPPKVLQPNCTIATPGGRFKKAAATKRCKKIACEAVWDEQIESAPWLLVKVWPIFYFGTNRRRDVGNQIASLKAYEDGVVEAGLVPDDDYLHWKLQAPEFLVDKKHPRVMLRIERIT